MTTFNTATDNLLAITPEDVAQNWTLGLQRSIALNFAQRDFLRFAPNPRSDYELSVHISGSFRQGEEPDTCPIVDVRKIIESVNIDDDVDSDGTLLSVTTHTRLLATVTCGCGFIDGMTAYIDLEVGDFMADLENPDIF